MKKKVLSLVLALALCLGVSVPTLAANATTLRNGETITSDVDKDYPGEYAINVTSEGDLRLDLKTDGGVHIELINSEGRHVAAQEYKRDDGPGKVDKETDGSGKYYVDARLPSYYHSSSASAGHFIFHVKPGVYRVVLSTPFYLCFTELTATVLSATATPTHSKVLVGGQEVAFDAYTINENNYFKLRDLAEVLSATDKRFDVSWSGENNAIDLLSGQRYTSVGGELASGDGKNKSAQLNTSSIYLDGEELQLTAYTINQNNYFKLRDIGQTFGFNVTWDGAQNAILIDTTQGYTAD